MEEKNHRVRRIINKITIIVLIILVLILIDVSLVTYFQKGPFLAIPLHTYDDGGTKEYYGLGYKVIKYNQLQGRRDKEIGPWSLKYNVNPIYVSTLDLAIDFVDNYEKAKEQYENQLLVITGVLKEINNNNLTLSYTDEGEKYSLDIICTLELSIDKDDYQPNDTIKVMGTMVKYKKKENNDNSKLYLQHCFVEEKSKSA